MAGYVRDAADRVLSRGGAGPETQAMLLRLADSAGGGPVTREYRAPWDAQTRTDLRALPAVPAARGTGHPGWVTARHRIQVAVTVSLITALLYLGQHLLWPHSPVPHGWLAWTWSWTGVLWAVPFIPGAFELAGLLLWRAPRAPARPVRNLVCWRIVSRGLNKEALCDTIFACRLEMDRTPLFPYVIEVVLDHDTALAGLPRERPDLHYICVPPGYSTPGGTRNKARALNYALEASPLPGAAWIVHLDEETHPAASGIRGIAAAIGKRRRRGGCGSGRARSPTTGTGRITRS